MSEPLRLNLGAGGCPLPGYINVDCGYTDEQLSETDPPRMRGRVFPLTASDESADEIRASHILEHFSHRETANVLREWVRVLKPGGLLRVAVPDFRWIAEQYLAGADINAQGYVMGGQVDENDHHGAIFDRDGLEEAFRELGLVEVGSWASEIQDCAALPCSLNVQGRKAGGEAAAQIEKEWPRLTSMEAAGEPIVIPPGAVKAIMTMPRLAFTDNLFCASKALWPLGIQLERTGGVFWCQGMTEAILPHLEDGTRYVLCIDYDSVYERADVLELVRVMETRPNVDALCAIQMRREEDSPLFCVGEFADGPNRCGPREVAIPRELLAADTMPLVTGHFGLTMLRVDSLRRFPHPWFLAVPDEEGKWGNGRIDADINFWKRWRDAGLSLHSANRVSIGHLELQVSWPSDRLKVLHQYVSEYNAHGKPAEVWR